jgi:L-iditol 2-dehydrogenase
MRAAVLYGPLDLRIEHVAVPRLEPGDVLLRTRAALTCGTDAKTFRRGYHARMMVPPTLFGHEVSGIVETVGPGPHGVEPGARVVAANSAPCGECEYCRAGRENLCDDLLFWNGAYAELARIPARIARRNLIRIPEDVSFRDAALTEPLACCVRGVDDSRIVPGQTVAVVGAGSIGLMLAALAKRRGARVVVAARRKERLARALDLGAEEVLQVGPGDDLSGLLRKASPGERGPHVILEAAGTAATTDAAIRAVRKGGVVNLFAGCARETRISLDVERVHYEEVTVTSSFHHTPQSLREAFRLIAKKQIDPSLWITAEAPLDDLPEVLREMGRGQGLKTLILP